MFCGICNNHLTECTCADIDQRLREASDPGSAVASRWCANCDKHWARHNCNAPDWKLRVNGELIDHPSLEPFKDQP